MIWPVCVNSKGRATTSTTIPMLVREGIRPMVFVEPAEAEAYKNLHPGASIITLPGNGIGLPASRNAVLDFVRGHLGGWYWVMDDDILFLTISSKHKSVQATTRRVLTLAQKLIVQSGAAHGGLSPNFYAWSKPWNSYTMGRGCDIVTAIHSQRTRPLRYRDKILRMRADRDFTLQVITSGMGSVQLNGLGYSRQQGNVLGSMSGGLEQEYRNGTLEQADRIMCERLWPGICVMRYSKRVDGMRMRTIWRACEAKT